MNDDVLLLRHGLSGATHVATGGAARVYRLGDRALKVVDAPLAPSLREEGRLLRKLDVPVVPRVLQEAPCLLVLEWLEGETLAQWLGAPHPHEARRALALALATSLASLHARGVIHRDVKSSNVMVTASGPRWFDLGLAQEVTALSPGLLRQGTRTTMAPEAWAGDAASTRTDVYSLGVLLYEVLTGRPPFSGDAAALEFAHRSLRPPPMGLPVELEAVVLRCLEKAPAARYADAGDVAAGLAAAFPRGSVPSGGYAAPVAAGEPTASLRENRAHTKVASSPLTEVPTASLREEPALVVQPLVGSESRPASTPASFRESSAKAPVASSPLTKVPTALVGPAPMAASVSPSRLDNPEAPGASPTASLRDRPAQAAGASTTASGPWNPAEAPVASSPLTEASAAPPREHRAQAPGGPEPLPASASAGLAPTALLALRASMPLRTLTARLSDVGAVWVGGVGAHHLFAHAHPLGAAHGLSQLDGAAKDLGADFTLHVAPLRLRVGTLSVRVSGAALEDTAWISQRSGRVVTAAAEALLPRAAAPAPAPELVPWLDDGTRLPPIEAALRQGPVLVWVQVAPGGGRSRLLEELAARLSLQPTGADGEVLLVDDAERLTWQQWEWLESITAPGAETPTDVVLVGDARVRSLRPHLGSRAARFVVTTPSPLSMDEARALVRAHLAPAALLPEALVQALAEAAGGSPGALVETLQALRKRGLLARDVGTGEWRLSSDVRDVRAMTRSGRDALRELPEALHDLARLLALARWPLDAVELDVALRALPEVFGAKWLDAGAALGQLVAQGLGALDGGRFTWARHALRRALAGESGPRVTQLERALAVAARSAARTEALAHHAWAAGWREVAMDACAEAGLASLARGDAIGADVLLSRALDAASSPGAVEAAQAPRSAVSDAPAVHAGPASDFSSRLFLARARARRQLERFAEALADARAVRGTPAQRVAARLEASLSLDWMNEFSAANDESTRALEDGAAFEGQSTPLGLELRLARGRLHVRSGRWPEALEVLAPLCEVAPGAEVLETVLGAHALAASVCCVLGELPRAEQLFAAGLALAARHGMPVVGCALLINRPMLWMARGQPDEALADLRRAATLSRRLGHAQVERVASHNLAQYLLWLGRLDEAWALARRARELATLRLGGAAPPADLLLLARLELARNDRDAARALLGQVQAVSSPSEALQRDVVRAWLGELPWDAVLDEREGVVPDELLDAALLAARFSPDAPVRARAAARRAALLASATVTHA